MFTRYKSVEIPPNYSGNRFKSEAPETETKMHKPSALSSTKTSISPTFESALKSGMLNYTNTPILEEIGDTVSDFDNSYEISDQNTSYNFEDQSQAYFEENDTSKTTESEQKSLLDEFKPFVSSIFGIYFVPSISP